MTSYSHVLNYLYSQLPMYHRIGSAAYKPDIGNIVKLCHYLGNPETKFKSIHVAGTNGKGSVSSMLASVLMEQGYKTALATSPHLKDFRERIRINGQMISKKEVVEFVNKNRAFFESISPSFFELSIALTFDYFAKNKVDIAVIETGLGGRLDSTNIITPLISVITNIGLDHVNLLGDTLEKIAAEKAGIIKKGIPVVIGRYQPDINHVFAQKALLEGSMLYNASELFKLSGSSTEIIDGIILLKVIFKTSENETVQFFSDLWGVHQPENLTTVLAAVDVLNRNGFTVSDDAIKRGLANVTKNSGLKGRWQQVGKKPMIFLDTAHNVDGLKGVVSQLLSLPFDKLHIVLGMVDDKDIGSVLSVFPKNAAYYFCRPNIPRGLDAKKLYHSAKEVDLFGKAFSSVSAAFKAAKQNATRSDLIFVGGSTFVVAEVV